MSAKIGLFARLLAATIVAVAAVACAPAGAPRTATPTVAATAYPPPSATAVATIAGSATAQAGTAVGSATAVVGTVGPGVTVTPLPPGATPPPAPSAAPSPTATPPATPTPPPGAGPGVYGLLTVGPTCPVQRVDQPCPDRAYAGTLTFEDASGREVARVTAGADGQYAVGLAPGAYHVVPSAVGGAVFPHAAPADVMVSGTAWSRLDVTYDSGIR